ncbi:MAG: hypothetical protein OEY17_03740 [Nitrosopumilus sp.]|nr:hypothetical protein [Nitrosopumilus sp.]MDH5658439.1 hypothetical protein [Nitrosopumilus sp.]
MGSLVDFNIAQSSSSNMSNIKWTKKSHVDKKPKSKKKVKTSSSNIIYTENHMNPSVPKVFIVIDSDKTKNKMTKVYKKIQKASSSNCNIKQGFKRPGR